MKSESNYEHQRKGHSNYTKYALLGFNVAIAVSSIVLIKNGGSINNIVEYFYPFVPYSFHYISALFNAIGAIVLIIAIIGAFGAIKLHYPIILTFAVLLTVISTLEFSVGIYGRTAFSQEYGSESLGERMKSAMFNYEQGGNLIWDKIQTEFQCCGVTKPYEWDYVLHGTPISCCKFKPGSIDEQKCTKENKNLYRHGCYPYIATYLNTYAGRMSFALMFIAIIQYIGAMLTLHMARTIRIEKKVFSSDSKQTLYTISK